MNSATLVTMLTTLTTAMAVAAPIVVFGFLYVLQVHPARAAATDARNRLAVAREEMDRQRLFVARQPVVVEVTALEEFAARTGEGDGVEQAVDTLNAVLDGPAVGGVSNVSVERGAAENVPTESPVRLFSQTIMQTPVTLTFEARFEQVGRFFWNLRVLPTPFHLQSVELTPVAASSGALMRATVSLLAFHHVDAAATQQASASEPVDVITSPKWTRNPFADTAPAKAAAAPKEPDAVVSTILFSSGRRVAIVDGRIVGTGDRVPAGIVRAIESDAVVIVDMTGRERRVAIARPEGPLVKR